MKPKHFDTEDWRFPHPGKEIVEHFDLQKKS